jgi:SAM-dependent methyltransferase
MDSYDPEVYWSRVGEEIEKRGTNYVAGDENPYYAYKRRRFLKHFLDTIDFKSKVVLELGCGPGGNLKHIAEHHTPRRLLGADVSQTMVEIATKNLNNSNVPVEVTKIDGASLPFADKSVDTSLTVTVLHHNTDANVFKNLVQELCRITKTTIVIMEDIGTSEEVGGHGDWVGRTVKVYETAFRERGFQLSDVRFLNTKVSRTWHWLILGFYRRVVAKRHHEGARMTASFRSLIGLPLPITRIFDNLIADKKDLAKMVFLRS